VYLTVHLPADNINVWMERDTSARGNKIMFLEDTRILMIKLNMRIIIVGGWDGGGGGGGAIGKQPEGDKILQESLACLMSSYMLPTPLRYHNGKL
jgi:hypothetical protein